MSLTHDARPFRYGDLEAMPDDGYRREVIGGSLIVTPSPGGGHQRVVGNLFSLLRGSETDQVMAMIAPYDWKTPDGGSVQPDVLVIRREDFDRSGPLPLGAIPLLVVEVLSPSNPAQDRMLKRDLYQRLKVPGYWIIDPVQPSLLALRLVVDEYQIEADTTETFHTDWPFPLTVQVHDLAN